ncbi:MAG: hypothetical protein KatS3mg111_4356 [Pirellulaceae bacterium]|nr:MAG: hypothetical protein KatS3mg111_4356 [Pirellulaceae bacterium]
MKRQNIADLQPREQVDEVYRVADKQVRANRQGNDYLLLQLTDRTGNISGLKWNAGQSLYETFQKGDFLRIVGNAQLHNGTMQILVQDLEVVPPDSVDPADFSKTHPEQIDAWMNELHSILAHVQQEDLRAILDDYLQDTDLLERLRRAPAGIKTHHAFEGGLLRHVLDLLRVAQAIAPLYPQLDQEMLLVGVFLHDLGKLDELSYDGDMTYTDSGQLIGHLVQGAADLQVRALRLGQQRGRPLDAQVLWRLQHMILSHHGQLEHGSPKVPMTIEAIALAYIDDLDAKLNAATDIIAADRNSDSNWTAFVPILGRKLFKPSLSKSPPPT